MESAAAPAGVTLSAGDVVALEAALRCAVCFETFSSPATLPCGHSFCRQSCLAPWLEASSSCPICREPTLALPPKNLALAVAARIHRGQSEAAAAQAEALSAQPPAELSPEALSRQRFSLVYSMMVRARDLLGAEVRARDLPVADPLPAFGAAASYAIPLYNMGVASLHREQAPHPGGAGGRLERSSNGSWRSGAYDDDDDAAGDDEAVVVDEFRARVLSLVCAAAPGEAVLASTLGSSIARAERPFPERPLLDQVEEFVAGVVVERGGRGGGRVASADDEVAAFGIRVRMALRPAGGTLSGGELGTRVPQRPPGGDRLSELVERVEGVAVSRPSAGARGSWVARLVG